MHAKVDHLQAESQLTLPATILDKTIEGVSWTIVVDRHASVIIVIVIWIKIGCSKVVSISWSPWWIFGIAFVTIILVTLFLLLSWAFVSASTIRCWVFSWIGWGRSVIYWLLIFWTSLILSLTHSILWTCINSDIILCLFARRYIWIRCSISDRLLSLWLCRSDIFIRIGIVGSINWSYIIRVRCGCRVDFFLIVFPGPTPPKRLKHILNWSELLHRWVFNPKSRCLCSWCGS